MPAAVSLYIERRPDRAANSGRPWTGPRARPQDVHPSGFWSSDPLKSRIVTLAYRSWAQGDDQGCDGPIQILVSILSVFFSILSSILGSRRSQ
ncbi:uncharacterized protein BDW70DRAFT_142377 [Aspergillus foveolatus]|uniref:uncharacterized protein n=1 Tax=Aspergillus foveolatus TaxID=210207 RepID=UPI003CCCFDA0